MGPCVGPPMQKRGRLSGRSGDLLGSRPLEKVGRNVMLLFICCNSVIYSKGHFVVKTKDSHIDHFRKCEQCILVQFSVLVFKEPLLH